MTNNLTPREQQLNIESQYLSNYACKTTAGRAVYEKPCDIRTDFARDRDRIIHCSAFRRLKHKTQVFLIPKSDHYRTRLTHTLEVSQIARTVSRALRLNEDLTEAIALGHDLGHTPFGHDGERVLNELSPHGFKHYMQGIRVVTYIEKNGSGLNLTPEVLDGIVCHTNMTAKTLEGQVVRFADSIAFINHDIEDAIRSKVLSVADLPKNSISVLGDTKSKRITTLIWSLIDNSTDAISFDKAVGTAHDELKDFMYANVYSAAMTVKEKQKAQYIIEYLYKHFMEAPEKMPQLYIDLADKFDKETAVCDYISGMTDDYSVNYFKSLCIPNGFD